METFTLKCKTLLRDLIEDAQTVAKEILTRFCAPSPRILAKMPTIETNKKREIGNLLTLIQTEHIYPLQTYLWEKSGSDPAKFQQSLKTEGVSFWLLPIQATYQTLHLFEYQAKWLHSLLLSASSFKFIALLCPFTFQTLREQFEKADGKEIVSDPNTFITENAAKIVEQAVSKMEKVHKGLNKPNTNQDLLLQAKTEIENKKKEIIDPLLDQQKDTASDLFHVQLAFYQFVNEVNEICRLKLIENYHRCGFRIDESKIDF